MAKSRGPEVVKSLCFSEVLSCLELKEILKLQILSSFSYKKGVPRALFSVPIVFREPLAFH